MDKVLMAIAIVCLGVAAIATAALFVTMITIFFKGGL